MLRKLLNKLKYPFSSKVSHTFQLTNEGNILDGSIPIIMTFNTCNLVKEKVSQSVSCDSYIRVSNKPSSDDDFVMVKTHDWPEKLCFTVTKQDAYTFCKYGFKKYFSLNTNKLFVKLLS